MATWDTSVVGTAGSDAVSYNVSQVTTSSLVTAYDWSALANAVASERTRRGLSSTTTITATTGNLVYATDFNTIRSAASSFMTVPDAVTTSTLISATAFNVMVQNLNTASGVCQCNCDYCTCQCNYCTCNCAYSCTCNCAYHFVPMWIEEF